TKVAAKRPKARSSMADARADPAAASGERAGASRVAPVRRERSSEARRADVLAIANPFGRGRRYARTARGSTGLSPSQDSYVPGGGGVGRREGLAAGLRRASDPE